MSLTTLTLSSLQQLHNLPLAFVTQLVRLPLSIALAPWNGFIYFVQFCTSLLLRFLNLAGAPPPSITSSTKYKELEGIVEHLHQREDNYRRKIKELQEELVRQTNEKKKAIVKLKKARAALAERDEEVLALSQLQGAGPGPSQSDRSRRGMHLSAAGAGISFLRFLQKDLSSVERKLGLALAFPMLLIYLLACGRSKPNWASTTTFCLCWFLIGLTAFHSI